MVLLDEIEKGHQDIFNILLQVFDEGVLTDGLGRKIDFRNAIVIMTSNIGTKELKNNGFGFGAQKDKEEYLKMKEIIMESVQKLFSPELVNRIDESIVFHQLSENDVYEIIDLQISDLIDNLSKFGLKMKLNKSAKKYLARRGYDSKYGVRMLRREIQKSLEDPISELLLKKVYSKGTTITIKSVKDRLIFDCKPKKTPKSSELPLK